MEPNALSNDLETTPAIPETPAETTPTTPDYDEQFGKITTLLEDVTTKFDSLEERINGLERPDEPAAEIITEAPNSWDDVYATAEARAKAAYADAQDEREQNIVAEQQAIDDKNRELDVSIDTRLAKLEKDGNFPKIINDNDPNDPGRMARAELFGLASKLGTLDLDTVSDTLNAAHEAGRTFSYQLGKFIKSGSQPSGADAPISAPGGTTTAPKMTNKAINQARSLDEIASTWGDK